MNRSLRSLAALVVVGTLPACVPPAVIPTRPTQRLPLVEIQIQNTPTQSDDYVGTTAVPAQARIAVDSMITSSVPVTLKNLDFQTAPALRFGTSGSATLSTLNLTLPASGAWVPFVVAGAPGQTSQRDKDAVIEVLEARPDGIVLGRKALMVTSSPPVPATAPAVILQIGQPAIVDDYVTWRPMEALLRLAAPATAALPVTVRNMTPVTAGQLWFGAEPTVVNPPTPPAMAGTLALTLPADGSAVRFYVAGQFPHFSRDDKDAVIEVVRTSDGQLLGREGTMARVRRDAAQLNTSERDRFLYALARANSAALGEYLTYQQIHGVAGNQAHHAPAFLAWHRTFILRLERALQAIDPAVALHYWRFDQSAPSIFSSAFMGGPASSGLATFASANPLSTWTIQGFSGVQRAPQFTPTQSPASVGALRNETQTLALGGASFTYAGFAGSENDPHDPVHVRTGNGGWLNFPNRAVRDPLFFLLHSNVERLWAKWQWLHGRKAPHDVLSYAPQGTYPAFGAFPLGHYVEDYMWPWDGRTGQVTPGDPGTLRPATAPGDAFPAAVGGWEPRTKPRPYDVVNFDRWTLLGTAGLGYGYDDVDFSYIP